MKRLALALLVLTLCGASAIAQVVPPGTNPVPGAGAYNSSPPTCQSGQYCALQTDVNGQLKISGTIAATLAGFTPGGTFATLTATGSSASVALPAGSTVAIQNVGTTAVSCTLGVGSATALVSEIIVQPASTIFVTPGSNTFGACIDQTGSVSNLVVLAGGSGLGAGFGGGGGSGGGGGGAITAASGSYAAGAFSVGAAVDGWNITEGTKADAPCTLPATTTVCSEIALQKATANAVNGSIPAGTATIGTVGQLPYPVGATPLTASATGTTAATTATLAGTSGKTTYICGYSIRANATAAATVTNTITGVITATLSSIMWVAPLASGIGVDEQIFSPCIPASGTNQAIAVVSGAPGSGGTVSSRGWGYQL